MTKTFRRENSTTENSIKAEASKAEASKAETTTEITATTEKRDEHLAGGGNGQAFT